MYKKYFKRLIDLLFSIIGLLILSPIFFSLCVVLFIINEGKIFFLQPRPGKNEKIFNVIKFKSMTDKKDKNGTLLPFHLRVTKVGAFIRKYSLDEIPQLINVINNDMSLIGPRPLLVEYLPLYSLKQKQRHQVKPGITGWAQINGRNAISWEKKFEFDVWYAHNISFLTDLKIFFMTIKKVLCKENVNSTMTENMSKFNGQN